MMTYITILYNGCTLGPLLGLGLALGLFLWGILGGRGLGGSLKIIGMNTMNNFPLGEY